MADVVIVLSWNSLLFTRYSFMDSQGMLVEAHAQPLSKYSDGVTLSDGYAVILEPATTDKLAIISCTCLYLSFRFYAKVLLNGQWET